MGSYISRIAAKLEAIDCVAQYAGESMFEVTSPDNR
jgi:hypothetical protein